MPFKNRKYRLIYRRKWYAKNKESEKAHVRRRKLEIKKWFKNYKKNLKCSKCSESHPATLEFHHKFGSKKEKAIGNMVNDGVSIKNILIEIKKCQVLCANCHRKIHYKNDKL
jgi:hypothetical protein